MKINIENIAIGWYNYIKYEVFGVLGFSDLKTVTIAIERLRVCNNCDLKTTVLGVSFCDPNKCNYSQKDVNFECGCSCALSAKAFCIEEDNECPLQKWKELKEYEKENFEF